KTPLTLTLTLPPPPYARQGGEVIAAQLAKVGIVCKIQNVEWAQWLSGTYGSKNYDL
ncbi:MAG TPA: ABC transporter substrate-binding protein, partial [Firmicutes bacterium]|nr:ABC transporter substrate-binding protein [Bacillota bacterium]